MDTPPPPMGDNFANQPHPAPKKSNLGWIVAAIVGGGFCLCIPILSAILFPVFAQAKLAAKKSFIVKELKGSATAMLIYTADHDDHFPPDMGDSQILYESLLPYLPDNGLKWVLYDTPTEGNPNLSGKNHVELSDPASTAMLFSMPQELEKWAFVAGADAAVSTVDSDMFAVEITANSYKIPPKAN